MEEVNSDRKVVKGGDYSVRTGKEGGGYHVLGESERDED